MPIERLHNYMSAKLPLELSARQHLRLLPWMFALAFGGSIGIDLLLRVDTTLPAMIAHATVIGLVYAIGFALATALLRAVRGVASGVRVWHMWTVSLIAFVLGYYFLPLNDLIASLSDVTTGGHAAAIGFSQLLPVWLLLTYLFVQPYLNEALTAELARLRDINALLQAGDRGPSHGDAQVRFRAGRTDFTLSASSIRNVAVDDHYCYVHYQRDGGYAKRDLAMPLRDLRKLLPDDFVQVHRSHIVNLRHVESVSRKNRQVFLILDGGYEVPVSRHRLEQVLPRIRARVDGS